MGRRKARWAAVHTDTEMLRHPAARTLIRNSLWAIGDRQKAIGYRIVPIKDYPGRVKIIAFFKGNEMFRALRGAR